MLLPTDQKTEKQPKSAVKSLVWHLVLAGFVLILPLAVFLSLLVHERNQLISITQSEILGTKFLSEIRKLLQSIPEHRGETNRYLNGYKESIARIRTIEALVDAELVKIDSEFSGSVEKLGVRDGLLAIKSDWQNLKPSWQRMDPKDNFEAHSELSSKILALFKHVGDSSSLILDPQLDTYYLMNSIVNWLPQLADEIGQLRGLSSGLAAKGWQASESEKYGLAIFADHLAAVILPH